MTAPANANEIALMLGRLARDLDSTVQELGVLDENAVRTKARYEVTFARAVLSAEDKTADGRKARAMLESADANLDAEIAAQLLRSCRARIDAIKTRIDVGRSYGAALRAEIALGGAA